MLSIYMYDTNVIFGMVHVLRYIWYTRRFGTLAYSRLQFIACRFPYECFNFLKISGKVWNRNKDFWILYRVHQKIWRFLKWS